MRKTRRTRLVPLIGVILLVVAGAGARSALGAAPDESVATGIEGRLDSLETIYRQLHASPELSYQEERTAALLAERMRALGFDVTTGFGDYGTAELTSHGVVAVLANGPGPRVLLRTDTDALPVEEKTGLEYASRAMGVNDSGETVPLMHACGHDLHMATWLGAAETLSARRDAWSGTLVMVAQPAEERGAGARALLAAGLYERFGKPDYAIALHANAGLPAGTVGVAEGYALANVDSVDIEVRGVGGHGAYPHTTRDPVVLAARIVLGLQVIVSREISPLEPAVITVGSIHGGTKRNIIPERVVLALTVRSYAPEVRRQLLDGIRRVAEGEARAAGFPEKALPIVRVSEREFTPATWNDPDLTRRLAAVYGSVLGPEDVVDLDPVMGGEDFAYYTLDDRSVKSALIWLGAVDPGAWARARESGESLPSLHSPHFAPLPRPALRAGVTALVTAVLDLAPRSAEPARPPRDE